eukprot:13245580-Alexandrium_andersonii.AAC.1
MLQGIQRVIRNPLKPISARSENAYLLHALETRTARIQERSQTCLRSSRGPRSAPLFGEIPNL